MDKKGPTHQSRKEENVFINGKSCSEKQFNACRTAKRSLWKEYSHKVWFAGCSYSRLDPGGEIALFIKSDKMHSFNDEMYRDGYGRILNTPVYVRIESVPPEVYLGWEEDRMLDDIDYYVGKLVEDVFKDGNTKEGAGRE